MSYFIAFEYICFSWSNYEEESVWAKADFRVYLVSSPNPILTLSLKLKTSDLVDIDTVYLLIHIYYPFNLYSASLGHTVHSQPCFLANDASLAPSHGSSMSLGLHF